LGSRGGLPSVAKPFIEKGISNLHSVSDRKARQKGISILQTGGENTERNLLYGTQRKCHSTMQLREKGEKEEEEKIDIFTCDQREK